MNEIVSVVMSTYNESEKELRMAIESILLQTYNNIEFIIIVDNPNNDEIKNVLLEYSERDSRIKIIFNESNLGLAMSLNKGIHLAKGKYIARMDADDISFPNRIIKEVEYLQHNDFDMVVTNRIDIDESGNTLPSKSHLPSNKIINRLLPVGNFITHPSIMIKTEVICQLQGYRNFSSSQDYDLWLRLIDKGYKIGILDEPLLYYRIRMSSISQRDKYKQYLLNRYQKELHNERNLDGNDSFSIENLEKYLDKYHYYTEKYKGRFNKANIIFEQSMLLIKKKQYINGIILLVRAITMHKAIARKFIDIITYKLISKTSQ